MTNPFHMQQINTVMMRLFGGFFLLLGFQASNYAQTPDQDFKFIHISDTHMTQTTNIEPLKSLASKIANMQSKPAFVIDTGDNTEAGREQEYQRFKEGISGLSVPVYCTPGNHDVRWSPDGKIGFETAFQKRYQSFDHHGFHFILLDSTLELEHWGHLDSAQLKWLANDLKATKKETPTFLFLHHWIGRSPRMVDNEQELLKLIAPYNIRAIFTGHGHADLHWQVNGIDCFMVKGLYQGSIETVTISGETITIQTEKSGTTTASAPITIPRIRPLDYRHVEFLWDDPNIPMLERRRPLAELRIGDAGAHDSRVKAEYRIDSSRFLPMERDPRDKESVSFRTEFRTRDISPGYHELEIHLIDFDGKVYSHIEPFCVERLSGTPQQTWDSPFKSGASLVSSPIVVLSNIVFATDDGRLMAIDSKSSKQKWATPATGSYVGSPISDGKSVYIGNTNRFLYCFDVKNGKERWKRDIGSPLFSTPAVSNGTVCIGANNKIVGVDIQTGAIRWEVPTKGHFQSAVLEHNGLFYLGGWDNALYAVRADNGQLEWRSEMGRSNSGKGSISFYYSPAIASPCIGKESLFVCTNDGTLHAVNLFDGHELWTFRAPSGRDSLGYSSPKWENGIVYVGGLGKNGDIYAVSEATHEIVWQQSTGAENYDSSVCLTDKYVVIGSVAGKITWLDKSTGKIAYTYNLQAGFYFSNPVWDYQNFYFTQKNGSLLALSLPK